MATRYVGWRQLRQGDRNRIKQGSIYPYDTPGYHLEDYLYPVDANGKLVGKPRTLKVGTKRRPLKRGGSTKLSHRYSSRLSR